MLSFVIYFSNTFRSTDFPGMLQLICVFSELSERNKTEDIRISSGVFWCSGKENCIIVPTSDSPFLGKMQSRPQGAKNLLHLNRCYWIGIRKSCNLHVVTSQVAKWVCFLVSSQSKVRAQKKLHSHAQYFCVNLQLYKFCTPVTKPLHSASSTAWDAVS